MENFTKKVLEAKDELDKSVECLHKFYLTDKAFPIEERWEAFLKIEKCLPVASSIDNFTYDMLNYEVSRGTFWYSWVEDADNYDEWRELALATGTAGFEQDW